MSENPLLKTLVVYRDYPQFLKNEVIFEKGVVLKFSEPKLQKELVPFLGKEIDMRLMGEIKAKLNDFYHKKGLLAFTVIPHKQNITNGMLKVVVLIGKVGKIKAEDGKYHSGGKIAKRLEIKEGQLVDTCLIEDRINWLNRNPFRTIDLIYKKGEDLGYTDICLKITDRFPLKFYGGYDMNHYPIAGKSRFTAGFHGGNIFGLDHQANGQIFFSPHFDRSWIASANYIMPYKCTSYLKFFGSYSKSHPTHEDSSKIAYDQHVEGRSWQLGVRSEHVLKRLKAWRHELTVGYDYRMTNNFLNYSDYTVYSNYIGISQFLARYEGNYCTKDLKIFLGLSLVASPGDMMRYNHNKNFEQERPGAKCHYVYGIFNFDIFGKLYKEYSWAINGMLQYSPSKLMPTEELSLGGHLTVRGYRENKVIGDRGLLLKAEVRSPMLPFPKKYEKGLQFVLFTDFGYVNEADQNLIDKNSAMLLSVGPGLRCSFKDRFSLRFDYGFQLKEVHGSLLGSGRRSMPHLGMYVGF